MRKLLSLAAAGAALALTGATLAVAQTAAAPEPAPAAKTDPLTIDSPIGDLLDNPGAKTVIQKDLPALIDYPQLDMIKSMSLRQISQYPQANLDDDKLKAIQADLDAAAKAGSGTK
ncbi:MAG: hypothetical protein P4L64_01415 [Caulobacteraceae bacterium]|nr:hypothetical protein [Caulobacteraceae bacterium]